MSFLLKLANLEIFLNCFVGFSQSFFLIGQTVFHNHLSALPSEIGQLTKLTVLFSTFYFLDVLLCAIYSLQQLLNHFAS